MPTDTWGTLPEEKRERITRIAIAEFGTKGFSAGSLNVIAREAGIAKGSLFQDFEDKLDFFSAVCAAGSTKIAEATIGVVDTDQPFFDILRSTVVQWLAFFRDDPAQQRMAFATANEIDADARVAVRSVANDFYAGALRPVIDAAVESGELRADVDRDLLMSMIVLMLRHLNSAPFDPVGDPAFAFHEMADDDVDTIARRYIDVLERAFGPG